MFLTAPETNGYTLEEMDDVFNSGLPAWRKLDKKSRLEDLEQDIVQGNLKVSAPGEMRETSVPVAEETTAKVG